MTPTELIHALHAGTPVYGTHIVSPSPRTPDAVRGSGLDFIFIDTEHIPIDRAELGWMCQTYSALGLPPIVRIPSPDPFIATMVLDGGAAGVIAPYMETVEQVQALRGAVKLRPLKGRRLHELIGGATPEPALGDYIEKGAANRLLIINIESVPAIDALDAMLAVPGVDGVLIGPHDLSCSLGMPEQWDHPKFLAACETIFRKARAAGVGAGIHFSGEPAQHARFLQLGANLLIHSADLTLFQKHLRLELAEVKRLVALGHATDASSSAKKN